MFKPAVVKGDTIVRLSEHRRETAEAEDVLFGDVLAFNSSLLPRLLRSLSRSLLSFVSPSNTKFSYGNDGGGGGGRGSLCRPRLNVDGLVGDCCLFLGLWCGCC